jgi:serine/threonine-protein kinase RsbW
MMLTDDGPAFDPLSVPEPDRSLGVEERPIKSLKMALVQRLMDVVEYERRNEKNRLRLRRTLVPMEG